jgi:N-acyl-D-aspartate/D-glutamate deacylase
VRRSTAADVVVFDPAKVDFAEPEKVEDLPEGAARYIQRAKEIHYTVVNGSVLMKNGTHTGVYPGKVPRSI